MARYRDIVRLLVRHGQSLVRDAGLADALEGPGEGAGEPAEAEQLADDPEAMGPTFVKLGQLLCTRADLLPDSSSRSSSTGCSTRTRIRASPAHPRRRLALVGLGMTARLSPRMQERLVRLLVAVIEGQPSETADAAIALGERELMRMAQKVRAAASAGALLLLSIVFGDYWNRKG